MIWGTNYGEEGGKKSGRKKMVCVLVAATRAPGRISTGTTALVEAVASVLETARRAGGRGVEFHDVVDRLVLVETGSGGCGWRWWWCGPGS